MKATEKCSRCGFVLQMTESRCPFCINESTPDLDSNPGATTETTPDAKSSPLVYEVEYSECPICGTRDGFEANYCSICRLAVGISRPVPESMLTRQPGLLKFRWISRVDDFVQQHAAPVVRKIAFLLYAKIPGSIYLIEYLGTRAKRRAEKKLEHSVQEIETNSNEKSARLETRYANKAESKQDDFVHERRQDVMIVKSALRQLDDFVDPYLNRRQQQNLFHDRAGEKNGNSNLH